MAWDADGRWVETEAEAAASYERNQRRHAARGPGPRPERRDYPDEESYRQALDQWEITNERLGANAEEYADEDAARRAEADAAYNDAHTSDEGWNPFGDRSSPDPGISGGGGGGGYGGGGDATGWDPIVADIPIVGDLTGSRSRMARDREAAEAARRDRALAALVDWMPTEDELSTEYRHEGRVDDTTEEGRLARSNLTEWAGGGFTDADRAMMDESRRRAGMSARADREADMSALEARGMGGSGATLASMLSAGEGAADRGAAAEANMMDAAQQRQYSATNALGEWANRETDYSRGLEGRNTTYDHSTAESASAAAQRAHENRQDVTAAQLGYNPNSGADSSGDEEDEADAAAGGLLDTIGRLFD